MPQLSFPNITYLGAPTVEITSLIAEQLELQLDGSGTLIVSGRVREQQIIQDGFGSYYAAELESEKTTLQLSGAGDVTVWATEDLLVDLSGFGNVIYYGNPHIDQTISGVGKLIHMGQ